MLEPEVAEYPDTGKLGIFTGRPPGSTGRKVLRLRKEPIVDYFEGEPTE